MSNPGQNRQRNNRTRTRLAALLLGCAGLAHAAPPDTACGQGGCSDRGIDPTAIREAVREAVRAVVRAVVRENARAGSRNASADNQGARKQPSPASGPTYPANVWERRLGVPGEPQEANCVLSFGFGGTLGSSRFVASHALGYTQVWRDE